MVINGGNAKLRAYFEKYFIPKDGPMDFKYCTKAGYDYRTRVYIDLDLLLNCEQLQKVSENQILPDPINPKEALQLETEVDPHEGRI